jgi:hypothetical protein
MQVMMLMGHRQTWKHFGEDFVTSKLADVILANPEVG